MQTDVGGPRHFEPTAAVSVGFPCSNYESYKFKIMFTRRYWALDTPTGERKLSLPTTCTQRNLDMLFWSGFTNSWHHSQPEMFQILWSETYLHEKALKRSIFCTPPSVLTDVRLHRGNDFNVLHGSFRVWQSPPYCLGEKGVLHQSWWDRWSL